MPNKKIRVIVMGKGKLAIKVAQWFFNQPNYLLELIVPVIPEPTWTDSIVKWAKKNQINYVASGHFKDITRVTDEDWQIDLAISVTYDKIIKDWFIKKCHRIINIHNSPLPKYRGVSPINWALKNNENFHGVTIHEITPGIDDGPIISQVQFSIYPKFEEVIDVYDKCLDFGWELFKKTIPQLSKIIPKKQKHSAATYYNLEQNSLLEERCYFTKKLLSKTKVKS